MAGVMPNVLSEHIVMTPDTCGGRPRVAGRRITVQHIAIDHERLGRSPDQIASDYELTLGEVHAALAYYFDHRDEIEQAIHEDELLVAKIKASTPSKLA
jgi:uncharacterized protein (DUF433 family)